MKLSTVLLLSAFSLLVTGGGGQALKSLHAARGRAAALLLLLLFASALEMRLGAVAVGGGLALLLGAAVYSLRGSEHAAVALLTAGLSGMLAFLIGAVLPTPAEGALLPGVTAALLAAAVLKGARNRVFSAVFSQLVYNGCRYLEEYCLFDTAIYHLDGTAFDAAILAAALLICLETLEPQLRRMRRRGAGAEGCGKKCA